MSTTNFIVILDTGDAVLASEITSIVAYDRVYKGESHELPAKTSISFGPSAYHGSCAIKSTGKLYPDFESACKARDKMILDWESSLRDTNAVIQRSA